MAPQTITNVAQVPQRSPFRYPGGETWLIPQIRDWLGYVRPDLLVEPFAGGGIVSLTAAAEGLAGHVLMVELDSDMAAAWRAILSDEREQLVERILDFDCTLPAVQEALAGEPVDELDQASGRSCATE